jgi:hypothetical protein
MSKTILITSQYFRPDTIESVTQNEVVNFTLAEGVGDVNVHFTPASSLVVSTNPLVNFTNPLLVTSAGASVTIAARAPRGLISYYATPRGQASVSPQGQAFVSPPGKAVQAMRPEIDPVPGGGLDVTTEPVTPPVE